MGLHSFNFWLLYSSLMGSILIGLILVIRLIFKNRMGPIWRYLIWFLLILKLLIPYAPESSLSVYNIFNHLTLPTFAGDYFTATEKDKIDQNRKNKLPIAELANSSDEYYLSVNRSIPDFKDISIFGVWFIGVIGFTSYMIHSTIKLKRIIKNSSKVDDSNVYSVLEECKQLMNIKSNLILIETSIFRSPKIVGAIRPHIILPTGMIASLNKEDLRYILLHELAHLRRKDLYINWIIVLLQIAHWFNPLIWYAFYQMRQDREVACDASVLSLLKPDEYKSYGSAIISFLEKYSYTAYNYTTAGLASGRKHIKDRMSMIASYRKETAAGFIGGTFLFLLLGCFVLTNATVAAGAIQVGEVPQKSTTYEDLSGYFEGHDGAFVLLDIEKDHYLIYNNANSKKRMPPDSTYKIISSLVGLENGVNTPDNNRLMWDGTIYPIELWNRDQSLSSAMAYSVSWYFQRIDASVGKAGIGNYLKQIGYGNNDLSGDINEFWIESSLKISPIEQVEILKKLYDYELPFSRQNINIVKKTIKVFEQDKVALYGKTGTGNVNGKNINGWFVGFVESEGKVYIFATNIQGKEQADGANAKNITLSILKAKNIL